MPVLEAHATEPRPVPPHQSLVAAAEEVHHQSFELLRQRAFQNRSFAVLLLGVLFYGGLGVFGYFADWDGIWVSLLFAFGAISQVTFVLYLLFINSVRRKLLEAVHLAGLVPLVAEAGGHAQAEALIARAKAALVEGRRRYTRNELMLKPLLDALGNRPLLKEAPEVPK